jgi:pyridoxal/pyridoxine/pyridoxamine kinase
MILDHLRRAEDEFESYRMEVLDAKRIEKRNQIMDCAEAFINRDFNHKYIITHCGYNPHEGLLFWTNGEGNQLVLSMIIKRLPRERILAIWGKLFPSHDIQTMLDDWDNNGNFECEHFIYGYDHNTPHGCSYLDVLDKMTYTDNQIERLLKELTFLELCNINPKLLYVKYVHIGVKN